MAVSPNVHLATEAVCEVDRSFRRFLEDLGDGREMDTLEDKSDDDDGQCAPLTTDEAAIRVYRSKYLSMTMSPDSLLGTRQAAKACNGQVSAMAISRRVKTIVHQMESGAITSPEEFRYRPRGRPRLLTNEEEELLIQEIFFYSSEKVPVDTITLLHLANIVRGKESSSEYLSRDWLRDFVRRHKDRISRRMPSDVDYHRVHWFSEKRVTSFFERYTAIISGKKIQPQQIWNCDESALKLTLNRHTVIAPAKPFLSRLKRKALRRDDQHVTLHACCSASGSWLPPLFIYKQKKATKMQLLGGPRRSAYCHTEGGGMTKEAFYSWFEMVFLPAVGPKEDRGDVLLLLDSHSSHLYGKCLRLALANDVHIMTFPSNMTAFLQPLDVGIFAAFKRLWDRGLRRELLKRSLNQETSVDHEVYTRVTSDFWDLQIATKENATNAFRRSGLHPISPAKVIEELRKQELIVEKRVDATDACANERLQLDQRR